MTVEDNTAPVLATQGDITIDCSASLPTNTVTATDNCGAVSSSNATILIPYLDTNWKYLVIDDHTNNCDIPTGMETAGYDDSAWAVGGGGFADINPFQPCGNLPAATNFPVDDKLVLRRKINLAVGATGIHVKLAFDNFFQVWFNGTMLSDCSVTTGCAERDAGFVIVPDNLLLVGDNQLVVMAYDMLSLIHI